jgi:hypothetical protein
LRGAEDVSEAEAALVGVPGAHGRHGKGGVALIRFGGQVDYATFTPGLSR